MDKSVLTIEDKNKLEADLLKMKKTRSRLVIDLDKARQEGDLKENSAYHELKNQLAILENRTGEIEKRLTVSRVVDAKRGNGAVGLGSRIILSQGGNKKEVKLVSAGLGNPSKGEVSADSPLGEALANRKKGEVVLVETPKGKVEYKIVEIKRIKD